MPVWQLAAGFLAAMFVLIGAVALARYPRPIMVVVLGLVLAVPTIALAVYAVAPVNQPVPGAVLWLAFVPAIAGLAAGAWMLVWMSARRSALTRANIELLSNGMLVAFGGLVLAISGVVAMWEPWFATANLLLNAGWLVAWIPRRWRRIRGEAIIDIAAPPSAVYAFLVRPANWPRYQEDVESAATQPEGELTMGGRVTARRRYESPVRGPKMLPNVIETESVVTVLDPDRLISMRMLDRPTTTTTLELAGAGEGTRMVVRADSIAPYRLAVFGVMIELRASLAERKARAGRSLARLKELLEGQPPRA